MRRQYLLEEIIQKLNKLNIRYLLIGRQAVMLYGSPVFSFDYDFWVHPKDKGKLFKYLEDELELEPGRSREEKRPVFSFHSNSADKIDVFIVKKITNNENETLSIDECLKRAKIISSPDSNFSVRVPCIDDLIKLKKIGKRAKDKEDIKYLQAIKKIEKSEVSGD